MNLHKGKFSCGVSRPVTMVTYAMAEGGGHWWDYEVHFDEEGEQIEVYINDIQGRHYRHKRFLYYHEDDPKHLQLKDAMFGDDKWKLLKYTR